MQRALSGPTFNPFNDAQFHSHLSRFFNLSPDVLTTVRSALPAKIIRLVRLLLSVKAPRFAPMNASTAALTALAASRVRSLGRAS